MCVCLSLILILSHYLFLSLRPTFDNDTRNEDQKWKSLVLDWVLAECGNEAIEGHGRNLQGVEMV